MVFQKGVSGNPLGKPVSGLQNVTQRLDHFLSTRTIGEIETLVRSKKEWSRLSAIDGIIVRRIHAALQKAGSNPDFTAVLDRFVGKPVQPVSGEFKLTHGLAERIDKARALVGTSEPVTIDTTAKQVSLDPHSLSSSEPREDA